MAMHIGGGFLEDNYPLTFPLIALTFSFVATAIIVVFLSLTSGKEEKRNRFVAKKGPRSVPVAHNADAELYRSLVTRAKTHEQISHQALSLITTLRDQQLLVKAQFGALSPREEAIVATMQGIQIDDARRRIAEVRRSLLSNGGTHGNK